MCHDAEKTKAACSGFELLLIRYSLKGAVDINLAKLVSGNCCVARHSIYVFDRDDLITDRLMTTPGPMAYLLRVTLSRIAFGYGVLTYRTIHAADGDPVQHMSVTGSQVHFE